MTLLLDTTWAGHQDACERSARRLAQVVNREFSEKRLDFKQHESRYELLILLGHFGHLSRSISQLGGLIERL